MARWENKQSEPTDAQEHTDAIRAELGLADDVPMELKPRDDDRTKLEICNIDTTLTGAQKGKLTALYPELLGKEV